MARQTANSASAHSGPLTFRLRDSGAYNHHHPHTVFGTRETVTIFFVSTVEDGFSFVLFCFSLETCTFFKSNYLFF
jgi:hypothetical protein